MILRNQLVLLLLIAISVDAMANNLNGTIKNTKDEPIPYATVSIKNSKQGAISNLKGEFTLYLAPGEYTLVAQSLGYTTKEQTIRVQQTI